jgi:hypothetical protein
VPPVRLSSFLEQFPQRNTLTSICNEDLSDPLTSIAQSVVEQSASCLQGDLHDADQDPGNGVQPECVVHLVEDWGYPWGIVETRVLECDGTTPGYPPCYVLGHDPQACPDTETHLTMNLTTLGSVLYDARFDIRCRI